MSFKPYLNRYYLHQKLREISIKYDAKQKYIFCTKTQSENYYIQQLVKQYNYKIQLQFL